MRTPGPTRRPLPISISPAVTSQNELVTLVSDTRIDSHRAEMVHRWIAANMLGRHPRALLLEACEVVRTGSAALNIQDTVCADVADGEYERSEKTDQAPGYAGSI